MRKIKIDKTRLALAVLIVLVILLGGYIIFEKYNQSQTKKQINAFKQGVQYGYRQAVLTIMEQALSCKEVPLYAGNKTVNLFAVDCLKTNSGGGGK